MRRRGPCFCAIGRGALREEDATPLELRGTVRSRDLLLGPKDLIEAGQVTPVIDRTYPLTAVPEAIRYLEGGHATGKVILAVPG